MLDTFLENHSTYVLIDGTQYQVLLDDRNEPSAMWSTILFHDSSMITIEGGMPRYRITRRYRLSNHFEMREYILEREI